MDQHNTVLHWIGNIASVGAIVTSWTGLVPVFAAGIAIIWYMIQIVESATYKRWRANRRARKLAHLRAKLLLLEESMRLEPPPTSSQTMIEQSDDGPWDAISGQ